MGLAIRSALLLLIFMALTACGGSGSGGTAPSADSLVGNWKVREIANESKLGGVAKDMKQRVITLETGGKFHYSDPMVGMVNGTWTLSGTTLTLKSEHSSDTLAAEGDLIYDRQTPGGVVITYEKATK